LKRGKTSKPSETNVNLYNKSSYTSAISEMDREVKIKE
jgi:hypothetical protein